MATTCRVSFNVNVRTLRAGDALHVCVAEPGAGAAAVFDPARSVPLVRQEEAGGGTPNVATAADAPIFSVWCTPKPLTVPWGVQVKYKYCVFNGGAFAYWEKLSGDTRTLPSTTGKSVTVEDTFGESDDDKVRAELETRGTRGADDKAKVEEANARLREDLGPHRKVMLITYSLPVHLSKDPATGAWSAAWVEDDFIARTPDSIADAVNTIWVGCVTADCIVQHPQSQQSAAAESAAEDAASAAAAGGATVPRVSTSLFSRPTAGGVFAQPGDKQPPDVPVTLGRSASDRNAASGAGAGKEGGAAPAAAGAGARGAAANVVSGGVTAPVNLRGRRDTDHPMEGLTPEDMAGITAACNALNAVPIFLPPDLHDAYASYCLSVLKPALHNVLETGAQRLFPYASKLDYLSEWWRYYLAANEAIARAVWAVYEPGDVAWLHDYQLCMVPLFLARWGVAAYGLRPHQVFFMHCPFPTSEIFRTVPVRDEILAALLESDVVGFHAFNSARHFLHSAKRLLGVAFQSKQGGALALDVGGRDVLVAISHVGVEAAALSRWMASPAAAAVAESFAARHAGKVILAGIDSCQRMSGVAMKLLAFERLLEENPVYRRRVVLVQRCEMRPGLVADVARTASEIRERVARIRSTYGDVIDYEEAPAYPPTYRVGLFHQADILLQTPIREGLNLLALEYVYVRTRWQIARSKAVYAAQQIAARGGGGGAIEGGPSSRPASPTAPPTAAGGSSSSSEVAGGAPGAGGSLPASIHHPPPHALLSPQSSVAGGTPVGLPVALPGDASAVSLAVATSPSAASAPPTVGGSTSAATFSVTGGGAPPAGADATAGHGASVSDSVATAAAAAAAAANSGAMVALMAQGMPEYYATLAAPPTTGGGGSVGNGRAGRAPRTSLRNVFTSPQQQGGGAAGGSPASSPRTPGDPAASPGAGGLHVDTAAKHAGGAAPAAIDSPAALIAADHAGNAARSASFARLDGAVAPAGDATAPAAGASAPGTSHPAIIVTGGGGSGPTPASSPGASSVATGTTGTRASSMALSAMQHASSQQISGGAGGGDAEDAEPHVPLTAPLPPPPRGGCVLLSEFSTASNILNSNLLVNPWNIGRTAREMDAALAMPDHERSFRQWRDYQYAIRNPAASWSRQLISEVLEARRVPSALTGPAPSPTATAAAAAAAAPAPAPAAAPPHMPPTQSSPQLATHPAVSPHASPPAALLQHHPQVLVDGVEMPSTPIDVSAGGVGSGSGGTSFNALVMSPSAPPRRGAAPAGPPPLDTPSVLASFAASHRRLLVIDYGGTLMNRDPESRSDFTVDGYSKHIPGPVLDALAALAAAPGTAVYVVSGLRSATVEATHLATLPHIGLAAENGMYVSYPMAPGGGAGAAHGGSGGGAPQQRRPTAGSAGDSLGFELGEALGPASPQRSGGGSSSGGGAGSSTAPAGTPLTGAGPADGSTASEAAASDAASGHQSQQQPRSSSPAYPGDFSALGKQPSLQPTAPHHGYGAIHRPSTSSSRSRRQLPGLHAQTHHRREYYDQDAAPHDAAAPVAGGAARDAAGLLSPPRRWTTLPLSTGPTPSPAAAGVEATPAADAGGGAAAAAAATSSSESTSVGGGSSAASTTSGSSSSSGGGEPSSPASAAGAAPDAESARLLAEWAVIKRRALSIMADYQWRVNGSFVREYDSLVAWDFRLADAEWASPQSKYLAADLEAFASPQIKVTLRKTRVELSLRAWNKGRLVTELLSRTAAAGGSGSGSSGGSGGSAPGGGLDFILLAGDDTTDEAMYQAAREWAAAHTPSSSSNGGGGSDVTAAAAGAPPAAGGPAVFTISIGHPGKRTTAAALLPDVEAMQRLVLELGKAAVAMTASGAAATTAAAPAPASGGGGAAGC